MFYFCPNIIGLMKYNVHIKYNKYMLKCLSLFFFFFLEPHLWHMDIPRLGVESEIELPAYATTTAMQDPSHVCDLHHISRQCRIPDSQSQARDGTHILMDTSQIHFHCTEMGTPKMPKSQVLPSPFFFNKLIKVKINYTDGKKSKLQNTT